MQNRHPINKLILTLFALAVLLSIAPATTFGQATITIVNMDGPNEGFNDPTPRAPVGGNPGTTLGQQRLIAFQFAADIWGATLASNVEIKIQASFDPLACIPTAATLGAAGAIQIFANFPGSGLFPGAEFANTWYHAALANKRAGVDLSPGPSGTVADDIVAFFNSNIGLPGCLNGRNWYYGLDANHGSDIDLVTVLLHEFGHGLGFANFVNEVTGSQPLNLPDVFSRQTLDLTTNLTWAQMNNAQRQASAINTNRVVWTGANVTAALSGVLSAGTPLLTVNSPASIEGGYRVGLAAFGLPLSTPGVTGNIVQALDPADAAGPLTTDACSPLTNAAAVAGKIALVDRGTCGFIVKVKNAQDAGAIAVIVADNVAGSPPPGMTGVDPTITIPSARISLADGNTIKAQLGSGVNATLGINPAVFLGADLLGRALLNAPNPVQSGSSISHWDPIAFRNQLMEPSINSDLTHSLAPPEDLTLPQMRDVGWFPDADLDGIADDVDCSPQSDFSETVVIAGCDSGVPNTLFSNGCTISDLIRQCASGARNHGAFVSCVAQVTNQLVKSGVITGIQKDAIMSCAGSSRLP